MEKVKLPREVAEAIEHLKSNGETTADIIIHTCGNANSEPYVILRSYADKPKNLEKLVYALVIGYEIEDEPITVTITAEQQERIKDYYQSLKSNGDYHSANIISSVFDLLGIKLPGVNA